MKLLLDTHAFLWWDSEPAKLSPTATGLIQDETNEVILSVVSVWEIQIKSQLGKLEIQQPLAEIINSQHTNNGIDILSITLQHVLLLENLPTPHKDPFDRLLIAQAIAENATLVSRDHIFSEYPVSVIW